MTPVVVLLTIKLTSMAFFVALCDDTYVIPRICYDEAKPNLTVHLYIACHGSPCFILAETSASVLWKGKLNAVESTTVETPLLFYPRDKSVKGLTVKITTAERITVIVGYSGYSKETEQVKFYNTFTACPMPMPNSAFYLMTLDKALTGNGQYIGIVPSEPVMLQVTAKSLKTGQIITMMYDTKKKDVIIWTKHSKGVDIQGASVFSKKSILVYIGDRLIQGCIEPMHAMGTRFVLVMPVIYLHMRLGIFNKEPVKIAISFKVSLESAVKTSTHSIKGPVSKALVRISYKYFPKVTECFIKATRPIAFVYAIEASGFEHYLPVSTLPPYNVWPQDLALSVPYDNEVAMPQALLIVALSDSFLRITINGRPARDRIIGYLHNMETNRNFSWGTVVHNETIFFSLAGKDDYQRVSYLVYMYALMNEMGYYFGQTKSCRSHRTTSDVLVIDHVKQTTDTPDDVVDTTSKDILTPIAYIPDGRLAKVVIGLLLVLLLFFFLLFIMCCCVFCFGKRVYKRSEER